MRSRELEHWLQGIRIAWLLLAKSRDCPSDASEQCTRLPSPTKGTPSYRLSANRLTTSSTQRSRDSDR